MSRGKSPTHLHKSIILFVINNKGGKSLLLMELYNFIDMKVNIVFEMAKDGGCSCFMKEDLPDFGLLGFGDSPQEAKEDMLKAYHEIKDMLIEEGKNPPELDFVYHYDMKSFFEYFDFLNVSKVAQRAGINPSLMRKYSSGLVKAGEGQYLKLQSAVHSIANELASANF
jgi:hypothetical protein